MRIRIHGDAAELAAFLRDNDYPHPWSSYTLRAYTIMVRVETCDGDLVGYIWATWAEARVLDCHVCIHKDYRGRWLSTGVVRDLVTLATFLGAAGVLVTVSPANVFARLLRPIGFIRVSDTTLYKDIPENELLQSPEAPPASCGDASA